MSIAIEMPDDPESSLNLLRKAQSGDQVALNQLLGRYLPSLERWASGRMSPAIRSMNDTADFVQDAVIAALKNLNTLEIRSDSALHAYLRQCVNNRIIDQYRRHNRRPLREELGEDVPAADTNPLEAAIGAEAMERYEKALLTLSDDDRQLVVLRFEFDLDYDEIASQMGKPSVAAARMGVTRALKRLAAAMSRLQST
jgi:RNA polymerase sigma-70 factor, ECF subfamily